MNQYSARHAAAAIATCAALAGIHSTSFAAPADAPAIDTHYETVIEAYTKDMAAAKSKYDGKRLAFVGAVIRMGSDPGGTYFGAVTSDGAQFDTHFDVVDQDALKPKFPGREIKAFTASANIRFSCLNEGYIDAPVLPGLKLTHCRLAE
ncbi:hypothetical protein [Burkholderia ubonensis]|uniref:hypothetical protein n=1 Tax=Burkholderia ubonensis TaxID=101571 RepID=UPI00075779AA|nr:hypothetical protein [Burkholderia ubonensis]KVP34161.1 hypothetical protein WJ87_16790 [Burkholderia ubonensis]KVQ07864.1 hypothetical protein WJ98_05110 [Burkholderia ubonensis]KVQ10823.1 hypothetical protein WK00_05725 [Burkholderia ubonensis]KVZ33421.1 hypothetical protein WL13_25975 [Burkholderia ubonensis]KWF14454.1 hypothetical protein WL82_31200 [Burkholderia ubonensis]